MILLIPQLFYASRRHHIDTRDHLQKCNNAPAPFDAGESVAQRLAQVITFFGGDVRAILCTRHPELPHFIPVG